MTYRGRVKNGVIVLDPPATLPEGEEVFINVLGDAQHGRTLAETLGDVIGSIHDGPADASANHDRYLYGTPEK